MAKFQSSRREFLRRSAALAAGAAAVTASHPLFARQQSGAPAAPAPAPAKIAIEHRLLGKTGLSVAVLGFGGAEIGFERTEQATVERLLNAALDAGMNVIDTAECYVDSEVQIAKAVGHRRKDFHLFTKCGHFVEGGGDGWSKPALLKSIERSLKRLQTDVIDLVQLHSCPLANLEKGECIEALEQAKKEGKTRFIGYSGDSEAAKFAVESGRFDTLQTSLNIVDQEPITLTLPAAVEENMGVIIKRTIANAMWRHDKAPSGYYAEYWKRLQELSYDFCKGDNLKNEGPDGPAGIAMRFVARQPGVSVMLVGTSKPERWRQNAELLRAGPLPKEVVEGIRARWKAVSRADWTGQT